MSDRSKLLEGCTIRLYHGASAADPVFRLCQDSGLGGCRRYRYDTYGDTPCNVMDWHPQHLGMGGSFGYTDDVRVLVDAIAGVNARGLAAAICDTLFDECKAMGVTVTARRELNARPSGRILYDIHWKDHALERSPVTPMDAADILYHHLYHFPTDPVWLIPVDADTHQPIE